MLVAWGLVVGFSFLFLVPRDATGRLQHSYARVFRWPLAAGSGLTRAARTVVQERPITTKDYNELLTKCQQFRNEAANLQAQLQDANKKIELLTHLRQQPGLERMKPVPAKIITRSKDELTIDRGQESGLVVGQYVLSLTDTRLNDQCVIGVIASVFTDGARVKLLTHDKCGLPVSIGKLGVPKLLEGHGDGTARIPLLSTTYAVKVGDAVYAERKAGCLDAPVLAGQVAQCQTDAENPMMWDITVQPVCDTAELLDVVVLKPAAVP